MIFDLLDFPKASGGGAKKNAVARPIHVSNSHKIWLDFVNGLGGDSMMKGRREKPFGLSLGP